MNTPYQDIFPKRPKVYSTPLKPLKEPESEIKIETDVPLPDKATNRLLGETK